MKISILKKALTPIITRVANMLVGAMLTVLSINASPEQVASLEEVLAILMMFAVDFFATLWGKV